MGKCLCSKVGEIEYKKKQTLASYNKFHSFYHPQVSNMNEYVELHPYERIILNSEKEKERDLRQESSTCNVGTPTFASAYASRLLHYTL